MKPNYYPGKPPEEQPEPMKWAGKRPTEEELKQILADHEAWTSDLSSFSKEDHLRPHDLSQASIVGADLRGVDFSGVHLNGANLGFVQLGGSFIGGGKFCDADLYYTNLSEAFLAGADLRGANLSNANVTAVKYNRKTQFLGCRYATAYGSPKFLAFARHQEFLEELRQTPRGEKLYQVWDCFADCGRTPWRWMGWSLGFCIFFAVLYCMLLTCNLNAFVITHNTGSTFFTMLYFSVVTFTTLGFGDVAPATSIAQFFVMTEVIIGYAMLGGLISIFATLITRRS